MDVLLPPKLHAAAVLALTVLALALFTRERVSLETASLVILVALVLGFELIAPAAMPLPTS